MPLLLVVVVAMELVVVISDDEAAAKATEDGDIGLNPPNIHKEVAKILAMPIVRKRWRYSMPSFASSSSLSLSSPPFFGCRCSRNSLWLILHLLFPLWWWLITVGKFFGGVIWHGDDCEYDRRIINDSDNNRNCPLSFFQVKTMTKRKKNVNTVLDGSLRPPRLLWLLPLWIADWFFLLMKVAIPLSALAFIFHMLSNVLRLSHSIHCHCVCSFV